MPSIEELLNEAESHMAAQPVNDVLEIDPETREISIPDSEIILGVETDQKAERKYFHCPKIVGNNIDLSALELYVVFQNASNKEEGKDRYHVTDVKTTSDGYITFSWELSAKVTAYKGDVQFVVCAIKTDSSGVKQNVWNTTIAIGKCLIGLSSDMSESEEQSASDLYTQLISELNSTASAKLAEVTTQIQTVGNNQVSNVNNAGATQVNNVQNKGTEVLASIPDTYTELDASVKQLNEQITGKAPVITESITIQSGSPTTVTDSAEMQLQGLRLYGKSEQKTTTGKNLLPITDKDVTQVNGVTFTKNGDGTCTVNGTASSVAWYRLGSDFTVPAGTYTISDGTVSNNQSHFSDDNLTAGYNYSEKRTVTYDSEHIFKPYIRINVGSVLNNVTFKPMLNIGSEALPFEPYTGGKPSPSPEYPQEIVSAGEKGSIGVEITGKNLFGGKAFANKIVELGGTLVGDNVKIDASKINGKLIYKFTDSSKRYTIIVEGVNSSKIQAINLSVCYSDGTTGGFGEFANGKRIVVTAKDVIGVYGSWYTGETTYTKFGIFEGEVKESDYEPYKESKAIIPIQGGLLGIPVTTGGNYTDENGQQYICDEIDFSRGKYVQRVWKGVFDGSSDEAWNIFEKQTIFIVVKDIAPNTKIMCNLLRTYDYKSGYHEGITNNTNGAICVYHDRFDTLATFKSFVANNPLIILAILKNPIETDLTEAQIQAYKSLTTFKPTSIISNDAGAQMEVEYACDTKTWVTNKINTLIKEATTS